MSLQGLRIFGIIAAFMLVWNVFDPAWASSSTRTVGEADRQELHRRYPNFMRFIETAQVSTSLPSEPGLRKLVRSEQAFRPSAEQWDQFFQTSIQDGLTNLRAFALFGLEAKRRQMTLWSYGKDYEAAVERNKINLGLSLPAKDVIIAVWEYDSVQQDPEHLLSVRMYYTKPYVHEFPDEIIPANLKVGTGEKVELDIHGDGKTVTGHLMRANLFYGNGRLGFRDVNGVSGQKRGILGFFQKVLFFIPDAVQAMFIDDRNGSLVTEAIINTTVQDFERRPVYRMSFDK